MSMTNGHLLGSGEYLRRMPPPLGGASVRWSAGRAWLEGAAVVGFRAGVRLSPLADVVLIGESLTDRNYRLYGLGIDAPGANLQVRLSYHFR